MPNQTEQPKPPYNALEEQLSVTTYISVHVRETAYDDKVDAKIENSLDEIIILTFKPSVGDCKIFLAPESAIKLYNKLTPLIAKFKNTNKL